MKIQILILWGKKQNDVWILKLQEQSYGSVNYRIQLLPLKPELVKLSPHCIKGIQILIVFLKMLLMVCTPTKSILKLKWL